MNPRPKICQSMLGNQVALQSFSQKVPEIKIRHHFYFKNFQNYETFMIGQKQI